MIHNKIIQDHGAGGLLSKQLLDDVIVPKLKPIYLGNPLKTLLVKGGLPCPRMSLFVKSVKSRLT